MVCKKLQSNRPLDHGLPDYGPPDNRRRDHERLDDGRWDHRKRMLTVLTVLLPFFLCAQTADDYFHGGATNYVFGQKEKAKEEVTTGLQRFPSDSKLNGLLALLKKEEE